MILILPLQTFCFIPAFPTNETLFRFVAEIFDFTTKMLEEGAKMNHNQIRNSRFDHAKPRWAYTPTGKCC
jgi:hypothetical protein